MNTKQIPERKDVPAEYKWDLTQLYKNDSEWEAALKKIPELTDTLVSFKGKLSESADVFLEALHADEALDLLIEQVYHYASLLNSADQGDASAQEKLNRVMMAYTDASSRTSFLVPEILSVPDDKISEWIARPEFKDYRIYINKILHKKPHILSEKEEKLLALQSEASDTASNAFSLLNDVDFKFGTVSVTGNELPLTHGKWISFLENSDRKIRKESYDKFYGVYENHANTLAALY